MPSLTFHLIPHTHWDREWYLTRAAFHARLVPVVDDLVDRLARDPRIGNFVLDGQTVHVEDYLRVRPDRAPALRSLVEAHRLEVGPWYVLADELIPSGEALVRNLLAGRADAARLGGRMDVLYSPDAFGHPAILPTLAREFGIAYAVLWRGLGGEAGQERDLYRWVGPDGASVLLYHLPPAGYEIGAALPADRQRLAQAWPAVRAALVDRAASRHVAVFIGADHHALHPDLPRLCTLLAELEPAHRVCISRLAEFLAAADSDRSTVATLSGELRWSYGYTWTLQGVHGTRLPFKRRSSAAELLLERFAEPLAALALRAVGSDRRPLLDLAWRTLLQCHFHDVICGSASDDVIRAAEVRLDDTEAYAREIARASMAQLVGHDADAARERAQDVSPRLVLWNPAARRRGGIVVADVTFFRRDLFVGPPGGRAPRRGDGARPFALAATGGRPTPVQLLYRRPAVERLEAARDYPDQDEVDVARIAFRAPRLSGLSFAALELRPPVGLGRRDGVTVAHRTLGNRFVEVRLARDGSLALLDRRTGERFASLLRLEAGGDVGDTYSYCPPKRDRLIESASPVRVRRTAGGPLVGSIEVTWTIRLGRTAGAPGKQEIALRLLVTLHADSPAVRCVFELDNAATDFRLRARIPTGLREVPVVAGGAFGPVVRAPRQSEPARYPLETPVATAPAHRFVAVARRRRGLAILTPGFCEYESAPDGELLLTLLRAVGQLSRGHLVTRPGHAAWLTPTPLAQCLGRHAIELALMPISERELRSGDAVMRHWEDVFVPIHATWLRDALAVTSPPLRVVLEGAGLVLSAVKPPSPEALASKGGGGTVLRCFNATERQTSGCWRVAPRVRVAHRVRADECNPEPLALDEDGTVVRFAAGPREIVTIAVE